MHTDGNRLRLTVVAVSSFLLLIQIVALWQGIPPAVSGRADFRRFYAAGYMVRTGHTHSLYDDGINRQLRNEQISRDDATDAFDSPAYEALFFIPFSFLKYRSAYITFFAANLTLLAASIQILGPYLKTLGRVGHWLPAAVFVCFFPLAAALISGHDSILLLTLTIASAVAFYRGRDFHAGIVLGLTLFRFQFAIPIALLFLFWRRWRMMAGFAATGALVTAISLALAGVEGLRACTRNLIAWSPPAHRMSWSNVGITASAMPTLRCLLQELAGQHVSYWKVDGAVVGCSILLLAWAATRTANFALAVLVSLLISAQAPIYDAALLLIPIAMVLEARLAVSEGASRLWSRNIASLLFVAPSFCFLVGAGYCLLAPLMAALLVPLRFTSSDVIPKRPVKGHGHMPQECI
jgi:hypothetical protein